MADLITLDRVKDTLDLSVSDFDGQLGELITQVSDEIIAETEKSFITETRTVTRDGGTTYLFVDNTPIVMINSITDTEDDTVVDVEDYGYNPTQGVIFQADGSDWADGQRRFKIDYDGGYGNSVSDLPGDIKRAVIMMVVARFNHPDVNTTREVLGDHTWSGENGRPEKADQIISRYQDAPF